ncbi:MAG: phosphoribosyltransferase family protein [Patescibacteria group bacterium]
MKETHRLVFTDHLGNHVVRDLPIREVAPGVRIALLKLQGDADLTEAAGRTLARRVPELVEALVMPQGKATPLLHVIQRSTDLPAVVISKDRRSYMREPIVSASATSITTKKLHGFCMDADDIELLRGKRVAVIDDVISTGGTLAAMEDLLGAIDATVVSVIAVCTEGPKPRDGVIALAHIPLF